VLDAWAGNAASIGMDWSVDAIDAVPGGGNIGPANAPISSNSPKPIRAPMM
jgi:hypothetical protein